MPGGVVIVGGGQAGLECAAALRQRGYEGRVRIVCAEPHPPYQRPPLSKDYLLGKLDASSLPLRAPAFYDSHKIELLIGEEAVAFDRIAKTVRLESGAPLDYDKLVLALGARNRLLPLEGAERVLYLRTRDESEAIRQRIGEARKIAVIGGGFIGLEIAAAASASGKPVTVIESLPRLMARAAPPVLSDFFLDLHRSRGVEVLLGANVREIADGEIALENSQRVEADLAVAGIGILPNTELAQAAGLETSARGIVVDEFLRSSDPDVYAIGDCSDHPNPFAGGRTRLECVQNAVDQAKCAARGILGQATPYRDVPWFWTDQHEARFQMAGLSGGHDRAAMRGTAESGKFSVFYFRAGKLIAVDSVNRFGDHVAARKILAAGVQVTPEQAADESFDLKKVSASGVSRSEEPASAAGADPLRGRTGSA